MSNRALRIAVITETFPPDINGVAMTMGRITAELLKLGHEVQVIHPRGDAPKGERADDGIEHVTVRGMAIPIYKCQKFGLPVWGKLRRLWGARCPDVAYIATEGPLGRSALKTAARLGIPVASGFHTNFHTYAKHYHLGFLKPIAEGYLRRFHNRTACTVVPTEEGKAQLEQMGYWNVEVMGRGVDTELFGPHRRSDALRAEWGVGADGLVAVYVGRIAEEKNIDLAAQAFHAMKDAEPGATFVLVGDGPARERLGRENPEFVFAGMRRGEDLAAHYASGDVFLFPSITETFGNVTTEAMASGLAVVNYDYAAGHMYLKDRESGMLVPFDDSKAFVSAAHELAGDRALITRLGSGARQVAESIGWDAVAARFEAICRQTMESRASVAEATG